MDSDSSPSITTCWDLLPKVRIWAYYRPQMPYSCSFHTSLLWLTWTLSKVFEKSSRFKLADDSHEISYLIFFRKLGKMSRKIILSSATVVIGALRVKLRITPLAYPLIFFYNIWFTGRNLAPFINGIRND